MSDKKKLTDKEKGDIAFKNMAIQTLEQNQAVQAKYQAKKAKSKGRANRAKAAKKTRNLKGFKDSLDRSQWGTFGGNPFDK